VQEIVSVRTDLVGDGLALDAIERKVEALVEKAVVDDGRVAVLYFTQASLLGLSHLREEFIRGLQKKYGQWLVCLADMSQMRFCDGAVEHYLKYGWNVIVEASTFFQAPLFASALMVPVETVEGCGLRGPVPSFFEGLKNYLTLYDVDGRLQELRLFFNDICNEGLLARWTAGLVEMQRFYAFPEAFRNIVMQRWVYEVRNQIVQERFMFLLEDVFCGTEQPIAVSALAGVNTILVGIPMVLSDYGQWAPCPCDVLEAICMYAVQDISGLLPASASEEELLIAACRVLVGFPVSISREFGALRLALSASMVSDILVLPDAAREQAIQAMVCNDLQVLRKIALVIRYFFDIAQKNTLRSDQKMTR
jgi:hypothetical protein